MRPVMSRVNVSGTIAVQCRRAGNLGLRCEFQGIVHRLGLGRSDEVTAPHCDRYANQKPTCEPCRMNARLPVVKATTCHSTKHATRCPPRYIILSWPHLSHCFHHYTSVPHCPLRLASLVAQSSSLPLTKCICLYSLSTDLIPKLLCV